MMGGVERDLAAIAARVELPAAGSGEDPRDRLAGLATWWAGVGGAEPPRRVEQFWPVRPAPVAPSGATLVAHRLDAGPDVLVTFDRGVAAADRAADAGADLLLLSLDPTDRDDHAWRVLIAHLLDLDPVAAAGRAGTDRVDDATWTAHLVALRDGLRGVRGVRNQPEELLRRLDSPALAAGTGLLLQASARRTPTLLDGPAAVACALLTHRIARVARTWWRATDAGHSALQARALADLRLSPLTDLGLTDEDGTAAGIGLALLETALARAGSTRDAEEPVTDA
jgi:Phosphoribosyltransferase